MNKQIRNTVYCITCAWVRVHIRIHAAQVPVGSIPCSSAMTSQNFAPIWFPHCPPLVQEGVTIDRPTSNKEADKCFAQTDIDTNLRYKSISQRKETLPDTNFGACYHSVTPCTCTSSRMAPGSWNHKGHRSLLFEAWELKKTAVSFCDKKCWGWLSSTSFNYLYMTYLNSKLSSNICSPAALLGTNPAASAGELGKILNTRIPCKVQNRSKQKMCRLGNIKIWTKPIPVRFCQSEQGPAILKLKPVSLFHRFTCGVPDPLHFPGSHISPQPPRGQHLPSVWESHRHHETSNGELKKCHIIPENG